MFYSFMVREDNFRKERHCVEDGEKMSYIEIRKLVKILKKKIVLNDISFNFEKGKIYGLYGRNGSGKTMLLRAIAGLIHPSSGEIVIDNKVLHKDMSFPDGLGVIIEHTSLLPQFDAYNNLKNLSKIKKIASDVDIHDALKRVGLDDNHKKVKEYSLGMRQKLAIAQAIFERQQILLLDEPTNGLDEKSVENVKKLFFQERERGAVIILASHNIDDLKFLCDEIIYMDTGRIKMHSSLD